MNRTSVTCGSRWVKHLVNCKRMTVRSIVIASRFRRRGNSTRPIHKFIKKSSTSLKLKATNSQPTTKPLHWQRVTHLVQLGTKLTKKTASRWKISVGWPSAHCTAQRVTRIKLQPKLAKSGKPPRKKIQPKKNCTSRCMTNRLSCTARSSRSTLSLITSTNSPICKVRRCSSPSTTWKLWSSTNGCATTATCRSSFS